MTRAARTRRRARLPFRSGSALRVAATVVVTALAAVAGAIAPAVPAMAADAALTVTKTVDGAEAGAYEPGEEFTYTITVGCDDSDCVNAELVDEIPEAFDGFAIIGTSVRPASQPATLELAGCSDVVTAGCALTVAFEQQVAGGVGIIAGETYQVTFSLKVPENLAPTWAFNGQPIVNTATATADTADPAADTAEVTIDIARVVDVEVGKTWQPETQQFLPGVESSVDLSVRNASNVDAETIVLQDPAVAADGAAELDAANPFRIVDLTGLGEITGPQGADLVTVDAYMYSAGSWTWVTGAPTAIADAVWPEGIAAGDIAGLRFTFANSAGATLAANGAAGSVALTVAQRSADRVTGDSLVLGASATNAVAATVTVPGEQPVTEQATAPYRIGGLDVKVEAAKSIAPSRIPGGTSAVASIGGKNTSNGPLAELVLRDLDYFTPDLTFGGFSAAPGFPAGANAAEVIWHFSDDTTAGAAFAAGETPSAPAAPAGAHLTGFELRYTGAIAQGAVAEARFGIAAAPGIIGADPGRIDVPNTLEVTGTNAAGSADAEQTAPLAVFFPEIGLAIDKRVTPTAAVSAGGTVVVQLPTTTSTDSAFVVPTDVVVEDVWREEQGDDFWNAFTPVAIAPTQVLAGSTLTIEALTSSGWQEIEVVVADETVVFSGALADLAPGLDLGDVTGLRFTFTETDGFAAGTTVSPAVVFQARATTRADGAPTAIADETPTAYTNEAVASASGTVAGGTVVESDDVRDEAAARIIAYPGGDGGLLASKTWRPDLLSSQSGDQATSSLGWGVTETGFDSVTITDPNGGEADPASTVFQAFDLVELRASNDSRWRWDLVSSIEIYRDGSWRQVPAPAGSWMNGNAFKGYALPAADQAAVTGIRISVVPNDAARAASSDPLRPQPGSGVTPSAEGETRTFDLVWKLRNTTRVPGTTPWVGAETAFNDGAPGSVWNTVGVSGVRGGTPVGPREASDNLSLVDQPPSVEVTKQVDRTTMPIPVEGEVDPAGYPGATYTIVAKNQSASRASYLRVTDPMPCTDDTIQECVSAPDDWAGDPYAGAEYDPATNPFERVDLTRIAFSIPNGAGVDREASVVTLWTRAADGTLATRQLSVNAAAALGAADLADVVGVSVRYQGTDPATQGGSIATGAALQMTLSTRLRVDQRSAGEPVAPYEVPNFALAQSYDPVLEPTATPYDAANADFRLVDGVLDVTAAKTISPARLLEKDRTTPVTLRLEATDGDATVATQQVVIADTDADFWERFGLVSLGAVQLPAGADLVRVDVQQDGDDAWVEGTPAATAALPAVDLATVTGIRFVFTRADGAVFSRTAPPLGWQASADLTVRVLDTLRGTDEPVPFPSSVENTVTTESSRADADVYEPATADATDGIDLATGTYGLDVVKSPLDDIHTVEAATPMPWTLAFTNTGTGYLTVDRVVDTLPAFLEPDFSVEPRYSGSSAGSLSEDVTFSYDAATRQVVFTWPDDGKRMSPAERFTIELDIVLQPGLGQDQRATNQFVVTTAQALASCTNTSGNRQGVLAGLAATECGTTNYVQPVPGASLATSKGVKGEIDGELVDGAVNTVTPGGPCLTDAEGYYRSPCAANTVVGATDAWKLESVNSGTVPYRTLTIVEPLPAAGDRMLATGASRGSTYRPVFDEAHGLDLAMPAGTSARWEVTTDASICVAANGSTTWPTDPTCSTVTWIDHESFTGDWDAVTGLRIMLDFSTSTAGVLPSGGAVTVRYQSVNLPATDADPSLAPVEVPVTDAFAWNQFGAQAVLTDNTTLRRAPVKAGVTLVSGPLQVVKTVDGAAARYAADEFLVDVACTVAGAELDLGADATVELDSASGFAATVDGVPLGAECTVTEQGEVGEFGETSRIGTPASVSILVTGTAGAVPADQIVTITNTYDFGSLQIKKAIDTAATVGSFGPFEFTLQCVSAIGDDVELAAGDARFTIGAGETHTVTPGSIPVGAECELTETETDEASAVSFAGDEATEVTDLGDGTATVTVGETALVTATNHYDAGTLSVLKTLIGDGAAEYGEGPFTASVVCVYDGEEIFRDEALPIAPDEATLVGAVFPSGAVCEIAEQLTGGANHHENPPAVVIPSPVAGEALGAVTALVTNDFRTGGLVIEKERVGDGVEEFGSGPFEAQAVCTWQKDGETLTVPLADGGIVVLDEAGGYRAELDGILVGAECTVTETDQGLATDVTLSPEDGVVTVLDPALEQGTATVVITNRFDVGQLEIQKVADRAVAQVGDRVTYTLTVRNVGQVDATGLTMTDLLPERAQLVSSAPEGRLDGRELTWTIDDLAVGASAVFTVTVTYPEAGDTVNTALITNPDGPWRPVVVTGEIVPGHPDQAAAKVSVHTLATTGVSGVVWTAGLTLALLLAGIALLALQRARRQEA